MESLPDYKLDPPGDEDHHKDCPQYTGNCSCGHHETLHKDLDYYCIGGDQCLCDRLDVKCQCTDLEAADKADAGDARYDEMREGA